MSLKNKRKSVVKSGGYGIDDLADAKNQSMLMGIIGSNKGITFFILSIFLFQLVTNILTWLLTFNLI